MTPHRFDPISALFGGVAVVLGLVVMTDSVDRIQVDGGWWAALGALALGVAIIASAARGLSSDDPATLEPDSRPD